MLKLCIEGFDLLKGTEVLNFMLLMHEIMTRYLITETNNEMINYLTSAGVIEAVFGLLKSNLNM